MPGTFALVFSLSLPLYLPCTSDNEKTYISDMAVVCCLVQVHSWSLAFVIAFVCSRVIPKYGYGSKNSHDSINIIPILQI